MALTMFGNEAGQKVVTAGERIYATADLSAAVDESDPRASVLIAGEGGKITADAANRLGLTAGADGRAYRAKHGAAGGADETPADVLFGEKMAAAHVENKMQSQIGENKTVVPVTVTTTATEIVG